MMPRLLAAAALAAAAVAGCTPPNPGDGEAGASDAAPDAVIEVARRVSTQVVQPTRFAERIELSATVEAPRDATLSARAAGTVRSVAELGAKVSKGDTVARLDDGLPRAAASQARAQIESAKAALALARENHRRQKPLFEQQIISALEFERIQSQLAQAEATLGQAKAARESAEEQVGNTRVVAPFDGVVEERFVEPGEQVNPGSRVLRVVDAAEVKVKAGVPERYATDIQQGAAVDIRFNAYGIEPRTGTVSFVGRTIDPKTRTFPVEVSLDNADGALKPEMVARLVLTRAVVEGALVVPQNALVRHENGQSLFVVEAGEKGRVARRVEVEVGARSDGKVVVTKGLEPGDEVVVLGQANLSGGDKVEVTNGSDG